MPYTAVFVEAFQAPPLKRQTSPEQARRRQIKRHVFGRDEAESLLTTYLLTCVYRLPNPPGMRCERGAGRHRPSSSCSSRIALAPMLRRLSPCEMTEAASASSAGPLAGHSRRDGIEVVGLEGPTNGLD